MSVVWAGRARLLAAVGLVALVAVVGFVLVRLNAPTIEPAHVLRYRLGESDRQIVIVIARGACDKVSDARAVESERAVRATILVERPRGTCTLNIVLEAVPVTLGSTLGAREVTDEAGMPLPTEP